MIRDSKVLQSRRVGFRCVLVLLVGLACVPSLLAVYYLISTKNHGQVRRPLSTPEKPQLHATVRIKATPLLNECISKARSLERVKCCVPWALNTDEWWTNHPDWITDDGMSGMSNATHTCFTPINNTLQREFLLRLHHQQHDSSLCANSLWQSPQISSGYAAALMALARSFYASFQQKHVFQYTRAHDSFRWNFATNNTHHWSYCQKQDMSCYFLPISPCPASTAVNTAPRGAKPSSHSSKLEFMWLRQYAFRKRHIVRQQLFQYVQQNLPRTSQAASSIAPCYAIHVRRTDIAFGKGRRYAAVSEYIEEIPLQSTIVLLTDDVTTIEEVQQFHADSYKWVYLNRPRFRGAAGGFEGFIPSNDPAQELLAIWSELQLASQCHTLVHGKSGFVAIILEAMQLTRDEEVKTIYVQTQQDKKKQAKEDPQVRAEKYLDRIRQQQPLPLSK